MVSGRGQRKDYCHSVGGRWVNKCLKFIRGVQRDSYYTNIHACFFSPPPLVVLYAGQSRLSNTDNCFFCVSSMMFAKFHHQNSKDEKPEPRRKHSDAHSIAYILHVKRTCSIFQPLLVSATHHIVDCVVNSH